MRALLLLLVSCAFPLSAASAQSVKDELSLVEMPVSHLSSAPMVVFLSGDGGWAALDSGLSAQLVQHGLPVIGWSSLRYYWKKKTPEQVTGDLVRILAEYQPRWGRKNWMIIGFSFGGDIVPFVINRMPEEYRKNLVGAVMLSPSTSSDFEIHVSNIVSTDKKGAYPSTPEAKAIHNVPMLCIQGAEDDSPVRLCPKLQQSNVTTVTLPGGHHFEDNYPVLYQVIEDHMF
ncbi:AcvB/VirJ family lysyl-phosphatidylglycerol hydrolase [Aeromonas hydrophila]|uniref:AcvB/VirJ family lysyl-phosphatidylglycerol hydrolase n=1 Tax=Aeromonas hydrophila TaxID=644 RepID=UPI0009B7F158|nr:AcvB/VirJ family lysyl-phosphatidylglycerol hydrolase [Aeromonas hydrophila]